MKVWQPVDEVMFRELTERCARTRDAHIHVCRTCASTDRCLSAVRDLAQEFDSLLVTDALRCAGHALGNTSATCEGCVVWCVQTI